MDDVAKARVVRHTALPGRVEVDGVVPGPRLDARWEVDNEDDVAWLGGAATLLDPQSALLDADMPGV
jgi:hypothetical protein